MKNMRTTMFIMLVVGLLVAIYALFSPNIENKKELPVYGGVYRVPIPHSISSLNPRKAVWVVDKNLLSVVYDPLIRQKGDRVNRYSICESWNMDAQQTKFECVIREGVKFHDGRKMTIDDIVFSLNYILKPGGLDIFDFKDIRGIDEYWKGKARQISGIYPLGHRVLRIDLQRSLPSFPELLTSQRVVVLPKNLNDLSEEEFFKMPIGTGAFEIEEHTSKKITFKYNEAYFAGRPYLDRIEMVMMSAAEAVDAFKRQRVDDLRYYSGTVDCENIGHVANIHEGNSSTLVLFPNNSRPPFNKLIYRQLLFSFFDKENTLKKCAMNDGTARSIIPRGIGGFNEEVEFDKYKLENVPVLLEKMKKAKMAFGEVKIYYSVDDDKDCIAAEVNRNFEMFKVPWEVVSLPANRLSELFFDNKTSAHYEGLEVKSGDAYSILKYFLSSNSENLSRIADGFVDSLLNESLRTTDYYEKAEIYKKIVKRVAEEAYSYPLYEWGGDSIYNAKVHFDEESANDRFLVDYHNVWIDDESNN